MRNRPNIFGGARPGMFTDDVGTGAPISATTWNPLDKNANLSLSNGNLTATGTVGTYAPGRATNGLSSGKKYFECSFTTIGGYVGLANATYSLADSNYLGIDANSWAMQGHGFASNWATWHSNVLADAGIVTNIADILQIAVDLTAGNLWFGINGTWIGGGNPFSGATPTFTGLAGTLFPATSPNSPNTATANFGATAFAFTPPIGFAAWG